MIDTLLTEKLRPKELKHMILPQRISDAFANGLQQNVLLAGSQGTGKTSLAKILAKDHPSLYINMSDESSVDIVRTKIHDFCSTISIMDGANATKVVIMDEMDGASNQALLALKVNIEKFAKGTRFIGITNYINKIPDPIQSRFELFLFDPANKEEAEELKNLWRSRIKLITNKLSISLDEKALDYFVKKFYPDLRSGLNCIQRWQIQGLTEVSEEKVSESSWNYENIYKLIFQKQDPVKNYQLIVGHYSNSVDEIMYALGKEFIEWIKENKPEKSSIIPAAIILVAQHQAQRTQVIDPAISLMSLVFSIQKLTQ